MRSNASMEGMDLTLAFLAFDFRLVIVAVASHARIEPQRIERALHQVPRREPRRIGIA